MRKVFSPPSYVPETEGAPQAEAESVAKVPLVAPPNDSPAPRAEPLRRPAQRSMSIGPPARPCVRMVSGQTATPAGKGVCLLGGMRAWEVRR